MRGQKGSISPQQILLEFSDATFFPFFSPIAIVFHFPGATMAEFLLENYGKEGLKIHQFLIFKVLSYLEDSTWGKKYSQRTRGKILACDCITKKHRYFCLKAMYMFLKSPLQDVH